MPLAAKNPDSRPLPNGWTTEYDPTSRAWYYVNTLASPAVTTWTHPAEGAPKKSSEQPRPIPQPSSNQIYNAPDGGESHFTADQRGSSQKSEGFAATYSRKKDDDSQPPTPPIKDKDLEVEKDLGMGAGAALALGAVGILGGALLLDVFGLLV
ncbi:hypothetical protein FRB99_006568 [Tulasnella sp. 403]|nr:hypothetical protein FRB99_006568 [Tulasnella sp. 403]